MSLHHNDYIRSMDSLSSPLILPPTSDPAPYDEWDQNDLNPAIVPSSSCSDELEAIRLIHQESIVRKNKDGVVIQHRAWKLGEGFLSDPDHPLDSPIGPKSRGPLPPPSSPPSLKMPLATSSPISYPLSSSPVTKRSRPAHFASQKPYAIGAFLDDESQIGHGGEDLEPAAKRRMLHGHQSPSRSVPEADKKFDPAGVNRLNKSRIIGGFLIDEDEDEEEDEREEEGEASSMRPLNPLTGTSESAQECEPFKFSHAEEIVAPSASSLLFSGFADRIEVRTCSGKATNIRPRQKAAPISFEQLVAARSTTKSGRAKKSYYGIDIHQLIDDVTKENLQQPLHKAKPSDEPLLSVEDLPRNKSRKTMMWTEKYRARRFFDLVGDDRTHREVLRWLKGWDPVIFPRSGRPKSNTSKRSGVDGEIEDKPHRKILLLNGPPGLGKTTLAHVCAMQAGYEVMEINASDERSSNVVKGRIRTTVGTESVKTVGTTVKDGKATKMARPVCVVVDEVDGVVTGSGGSGEGGFIKALIDLIQLDAKNEIIKSSETAGYSRKKKKGDNFRLLRPLILICNDVYHPSLRPLRQSSFAEVIHIRKPPLEAVVKRMKAVFDKEEIACDNDGVRKLCEATWGMSSGPESRLDTSGTGEGDLRSLLVVGEWVAGKLRSSAETKPKLTRKWVEQNMLSSLSHGGGGARGVGRGGAKEIVSRIFLTGAGFPKTASDPLAALPTRNSENDPTIPRTKLHASEIAKKAGMDRLREMVDTSGDIDRIVTDIFSVYPSQPFNDDTILSKPDAAYEWLNFHDACSSRVYSDQDWELMPYLSQPVLACHHLFASPARHYSQSFEQKKWNGEDKETEVEKESPFSGPRADYDAKEAEKSCRATILELQSSLNATLLRSFRSPGDIAIDLLPYLVRMLTPDVKPIVVGGSGDQRGVASVRKEGERGMVKRAVDVMSGVGVKFERGKVESDFGTRGTQWVYRMEPPIDELVDFPTASTSLSLSAAPVRYAVRQVLDQEFEKNLLVRENAARQARYRLGNPDDDGDAYVFTDDNKENKADRRRNFDLDPISTVKKDFFGRVLLNDSMAAQPLCETDGNAGDRKKKQSGKAKGKDENKVWVSFHEGFSNAVRKPVTVEDLLKGL